MANWVWCLELRAGGRVVWAGFKLVRKAQKSCPRTENLGGWGQVLVPFREG